MSPLLEEIIEAIKELTIKGALSYLVAHGVIDFSKEGYVKVKKIIQDKQNEGKYAFVPNKEEANRLLGFQNEPTFRQVLMLVPNYRYVDIIRTGMLIDHYHKNDNPDNRKRVGNIKLQITRRPNGRKLLKIANLPTTPFFSVILQYLHKLKLQGYSASFLEETLEAIVQDWQKNAMLVQSEDTKENVIDFCKRQMKQKSEIFFVLGMRSASAIAEDAIIDLNNELQKNNYTYKLSKSMVGNHPRTEIMFFSIGK